MHFSKNHFMQSTSSLLFLCLCVLLLAISCNNTNTNTLPSVKETEMPASDTQTATNTATNTGYLMRGGDNPMADKINKQTTLADVATAYGKENVKQDQIAPNGDMQPMDATRLFADTPNELQIFWLPKSKQAQIAVASQPNSAWHTTEGVKIGTTLNELVALNGGKHFKFSGFGWDYGGAVTSWEGGTLDKNPDYKGLYIGLNPKNEINEQLQNDYAKVSGEGEFNSNSPMLKNLDVRVSKLSVSLNIPAE